MTFHSLFLALGLVVVGATLISLRREHIRTEYSVSWLSVGIILTFLALFPRVLESAARTLDLDPPLFFVLTGGILVLALTFEISHVVSRLRDENVMLAQRLAILEYQLGRANQRNGQSG